MNKLQGSIFSIPMFFKKDKSIDFISLKNYIIKCLDNPGVDVIYAMSYNTRLRQLNFEEIVEVSKLCCELANSFGKKAIVGHPYTITNDEFHNYCQIVKEFNPFAISVLYPERYYAINQPLVDFYSVPKNSGLKVLVHEQKLVSGFDGSLIDWPDNLINEVFKDDNIIAVKEDSKNDIITKKILELSEKSDLNIIVAGGGKIRARKLIKEANLKCWLNGSLMLFPEITDKIVNAYLNDDKNLIEWYEKNIEIPYFDLLIKKVGWHIGHKAALHFLGYCELEERAPMPQMSTEDFNSFKPLLEELKSKARNIFNNKY